MARTISAWGICACFLAAALWTGVAVRQSHATFRVVPQAKSASASIGVESAAAGRRETRGKPDPALAGGARVDAEPASKCAEELSTLSLGVEDAASIERLRSQRCR